MTPSGNLPKKGNMKFYIILATIIIALALIAPSCPQGCTYYNNCPTWILTPITVDVPVAGSIHINYLATVGDTSGANWSGSPYGHVIVILDGEVTCPSCGTEVSEHTGILLFERSDILGTFSGENTYVGIDTSKTHTISVYFGQTKCANCGQFLTIDTPTFTSPPEPECESVDTGRVVNELVMLHTDFRHYGYWTPTGKTGICKIEGPSNIPLNVQSIQKGCNCQMPSDFTWETDNVIVWHIMKSCSGTFFLQNDETKLVGNPYGGWIFGKYCNVLGCR